MRSASTAPASARRGCTLARRKVVIIGNCQSETLRQGFAQIETLNRRFDVRYHFVQLQKNLHEFAARDLESCDILLIQDIRLWDEFPLRDCVRPGADSMRFPLVRFASLWPFDSWNGPGDKQAYEREAPNLTFPYLDGLLGRLRGEIPDPEARFHAYRTLDVPGIINYRRLHEMEIRRLGSMDKKFDFAIGAFHSRKFPPAAGISHHRAAELGGVQPVDAVCRQAGRRQRAGVSRQRRRRLAAQPAGADPSQDRPRSRGALGRRCDALSEPRHRGDLGEPISAATSSITGETVSR